MMKTLNTHMSSNWFVDVCSTFTHSFMCIGYDTFCGFDDTKEVG